MTVFRDVTLGQTPHSGIRSFPVLVAERGQATMAAETRSDESSDQTRLRWAAETTLLVWVRTYLGLMGFGFVVARFGLFLHELAGMGHLHVRRPPAFSLVMGVVLILLAVVVLLL